MAQHDHRFGPRSIHGVSVEQATRSRCRTEHGEVIAGHRRGEHSFGRGRIARAAQAHGSREQARRVHTVERRHTMTQVEVVRIRAVAEAAAGRACADVDECSRICHAHRGAEQERVSDGEDRRVGADADRQRQHRGRGEQRIPAEQPRRVAHVALRVGEPDKRARIPLPLLGLLDTTERAARRQTGLVGRQPPAAKIVLEKRQMRAHFTRELVLGLFVTEERREPPPESPPCRHH
jgi:hypothetical protein